MHMQAFQEDRRVSVSTFFYRIELTDKLFQLIDPRTGHPLVNCPTAVIYHPEFASADGDWQFQSFDLKNAQSGPVDIIIRANQDGGSGFTITMTCYDEYIEIAASTDPLPDASILAHWNLLAPRATLDMFHVHHWRNRHGHNGTYETYNLLQGDKYGQEMDPRLTPEMREQWTRLTDLTTNSTDWQFAPHPSFFLMQRDSVMMGIGARDLPHGFGLEMQSAGQTLRRFRFNFGGEDGATVAAGESATGPRFYLWLDHNQSVWDSVDHYIRLLEEDGEVQARSNRLAPHWWSRPQYCTWQDQCYLARNPAYYSGTGDKPKGLSPLSSSTTAGRKSAATGWPIPSGFRACEHRSTGSIQWA
jgi:hypothetical protein